MSSAALDARPENKGFWQRRVLSPLRAQLTQGIKPDRLALTLGVSTACSLVPFFGFTSALNLIVGWALKLNQPAMQALNQLLGPLQLVLILGYVRIGEKIWHTTPVPLSVATLAKAFKEDPAGFLARFGWTGVHAATAWALSAPLLVAGVFYATRPVLRKFSRSAQPPRAGETHKIS